MIANVFVICTLQFNALEVCNCGADVGDVRKMTLFILLHDINP